LEAKARGHGLGSPLDNTLFLEELMIVSTNPSTTVEENLAL